MAMLNRRERKSRAKLADMHAVARAFGLLFSSVLRAEIRANETAALVREVAGKSSRSYMGGTPLLFNRAGEANFRAQGGGAGRMRLGRVESRGASRVFVPSRNGNVSRAYLATPATEHPDE
jgi:hypothetical protein